jgi:pimeloyl-ACP methyl ester carboxylesterase
MKNLINKFKTGNVISKDGTVIGYREIGNGPGIILVHGGLMTSQNFLKLGLLLSDEFTVYIPDRRGRGLSGKHGDNYNLQKECEDIQALINETKVTNIFGLSSGAIISLQTTLIDQSILKAAIYEPPIPVNGTNPAHWAGKYEQNLAKGNLAAAFVNIIKGTGDSYSMEMLPGFILEFMFNLALKAESKDISAPDSVSLNKLIPTMHFDIKLVKEMEGKIETFKKLKTKVLLLGGNRSQKFLKTTLNSLETIIPDTKRIEFKSIGHLAADNNGKPELVAKALKDFFKN